jgi:hypothetical protein
VEERMVNFSPFVNFLLIELTNTFMVKEFYFATWVRWDFGSRAWDDPHIAGNSN